MSLPLAPDTQAALDRAKRAVPDGGELDVGLLMAALYHGTTLKERLPARLNACLQPPSAYRTTVPDKVPLAQPLQPLLARLRQSTAAVTPAELFRVLLDSEPGRACLRAGGLTDADLHAVAESVRAAAPAPQPAPATRGRGLARVASSGGRPSRR